MIEEASALMAPYDAMLLPTTPATAPTIEAVSASEAEYVKWNMAMLRNTGLINMLDGCAATIPIHPPGTPPVGLDGRGDGGTDKAILSVAMALEGALGEQSDGGGTKRARL